MPHQNASVKGTGPAPSPGHDVAKAPDRLGEIADGAVRELATAHELMDDIEAVLFGPSPAEGSEPKGRPGGLENGLYELRASASALCARLGRARDRL